MDAEYRHAEQRRDVWLDSLLRRVNHDHEETETQASQYHDINRAEGDAHTTRQEQVERGRLDVLIEYTNRWGSFTRNDFEFCAFLILDTRYDASITIYDPQARKAMYLLSSIIDNSGQFEPYMMLDQLCSSAVGAYAWMERSAWIGAWSTLRDRTEALVTQTGYQSCIEEYCVQRRKETFDIYRLKQYVWVLAYSCDYEWVTIQVEQLLDHLSMSWCMPVPESCDTVELKEQLLEFLSNEWCESISLSNELREVLNSNAVAN